MIAREDHLFGLLAVQSGLIDPVAFLDLWNALDGNERLPDLLVRRGLILPEDRDHLAYLVRRKLPATEATPTSAATVSFAPPPERYAYLDRCGSGGMGDVWHARDTHLDRDVAVKELKRDLADDPAVRVRFLREVRITSQLDHPGIVPIYDLLPDQAGRPRYAMCLLRGRTLAEAIRWMHQRRQAGEDISLDRAALLQAFVTVCNTVGYAHSRGVIHRDLKPANIQLGDFGEVVVLDWGLAGAPKTDATPEDEDSVTRQGSVLGTPEYMAPEQADGDTARINERSDIYGLGAILYCLLTGVPPFRGASMAETLALVRAVAFTPVRQRCPDVPPGLEAICHRALSRRPEDRHAAATDLATEILQWQESERLQAERSLRESEERLRLALDAGRCGVWDWDIPTDRITWSERVYEFHGLKPGEFGGRVADYAALLYPDDAVAMTDAIRRAIEHDAPFAGEVRIVRPSGEVRWIATSGRVLRDGTGQAVRMLGAVIDVTERRAAEEALRESERSYRLLTGLLPQHVWTATPDGKNQFYNQRGVAYHGLGPDENTGDAWQSVVHPDDLPRCLERWQHSVTTGDPFEAEFRLRDAAGEYRWHLTRAVAVHDEQGRIVQWFGTNTDIDQFKRVEAERDEALRQLQALQAPPEP